MKKSKLLRNPDGSRSLSKVVSAAFGVFALVVMSLGVYLTIIERPCGPLVYDFGWKAAVGILVRVMALIGGAARARYSYPYSYYPPAVQGFCPAKESPTAGDEPPGDSD